MLILNCATRLYNYTRARENGTAIQLCAVWIRQNDDWSPIKNFAGPLQIIPSISRKLNFRRSFESFADSESCVAVAANECFLFATLIVVIKLVNGFTSNIFISSCLFYINISLIHIVW